MKKLTAFLLALFTALSAVFAFVPGLPVSADDDAIVLRISNWEEYIDLGGWDEEETIDLESGDIIGVNPMIEDFEEWFEENYGKKVRVEYSTFGTNEDLYNMLSLGDVYDLVCPSEYMIMKLMEEGFVRPYSEKFFDTDNELNYYINGVSPYIREVFESHDQNGMSWDRYAAGYMWGVTGFVYNPDIVSEEDASTWRLLENPGYNRQITVKDNVRDTYFAAVGALKSELLCSEEFRSDPDYAIRLQEEMNDTSPEMIAAVQDYLQGIKDNLYSFETDSGKADMITGKVVANLQWAGDGVYTLDQAEEDDYYLNFAVPREVTNIYFDGWVMLERGIGEDPEKQEAAEAFVNFISRPDNAIRNMYYIGYTSCISGGADERIFEYADWSYGAEEDDEDTVEYPLGHFFTGDPEDEDYILTVPEEQVNRQLFAAYPPEEVIRRASIMVYFDREQNDEINKMWIRVRCFNIKNVPIWVWIVILFVIAGAAALYVRNKRIRERI